MHTNKSNNIDKVLSSQLNNLKIIQDNNIKLENDYFNKIQYNDCEKQKLKKKLSQNEKSDPKSPISISKYEGKFVVYL